MSEYRGLVNEGSTCYLNSLLQTLFMTPEFRRNIYSYVHDAKKRAQVDSIPYQLQKLFVKLQRNQGSVYSKGLLKSFGWDEVDSFQQHDVQQFCRKLFQAIELSEKGNKWIQNMYSGSIVSFISCQKHTRETPQLFMDLSLPIRNQYINQIYKSVEECLKEYLRPQKLEDKVQCQQCGEKVNVEKGLKLNTLPPILTLQLNRFQLNLQTFEREKVNNFVYFPQVLEMNRFLKSFENIELKDLPKDLEQRTVVTEKKQSQRTTDWGGTGLMVEGKSLKPKRKNSDEIESKKEKAQFFDEEGKDQRERVTKELSFQQEKLKNLQILKSLKNEKNEMDETMQRIQKKELQKIEKAKQQKSQDKEEVFVKNYDDEPKTQFNLEDDVLFGNALGGPIDMSGFNAGSFEKAKAPNFEKNEVSYEHEEEQYDQQKEYPQNTYILYSILVHSGGAYGGHYYAYIWNGQDWYKFNDNSVTKVDKKEIRKYGNSSESSSFGANAYLLFYRNINTLDELKNKVQIPEELNEKIMKDPIVEDKFDNEVKMDRLSTINRGLVLKIYTEYNKHETIVVRDRGQETVGGLKLRIKQELRVQQKDENWRLRRYNKGEDSLHQIYGPQFDAATLDSLGFRQTFYLMIEKKKDDEVFQDYDPKNIVIKLNVWRDNLTLLTEQALKPFKLYTRQQTTFQQFYHKVQEALKIKGPIMLKRSYSVSKANTIYHLDFYKDKKLIDLKFCNGFNLFVEEKTEQLKWEREFETQPYRCLIKYNNPKLGQEKDQQLYIDTRKTLGDLKQKLSDIIGLPISDFRIKRSKQSVTQLTTYKKHLTSLRFSGEQLLYIQEGKTSKGSIVIRRGIVELVQDKIQFNLHEQVQIQLSTQVTTVADLKNGIAQKYGIDVWLIRIRQFRAYQFGQIFQDSESVQRIKEKSLVWEQLEDQDSRGIQIYFRVFDIMTMELGPLLHVFIDPSANYQQLSYILQEQSLIKSDKILVWKAHSNFIEKSMFFDTQWTQLKFIPEAIRSQPIFLNRDGQIIILKEAQVAYHPKPSKKYGSSVVSGGSKAPKQAGLKITVIEQKQDLQVEQHKEQPNKEKINNDQ